MPKKLTYEDVKQYIEVESRSGCKLLSEEYVNAKIPIDVRCRCGKDFSVSFDNFKSSNKNTCNRCSKKRRTKKQTKTHEQFIEEVQSLTGNEYSVLSKYEKTMEKIKWRHEKCGYEYKATPDGFLTKNARCPKCFGKIKLTHKEFCLIVDKIGNEEYEVLETYVNNETPLKMKHKKCGYMYSVFPNNFKRGKRCPKCSGNLKLTNEQFLNKVKDVTGEEYTFIEKYNGADRLLHVKHSICGKLYRTSPYSFLNRGTRCPFCCNIRKSYGSKQIENYLKFLELNYEREYRFEDFRSTKSNQRYPFDFAIFNKQNNLKCLIEFDGKQHYYAIEWFGGEKNLKDLQFNDQIKNKYCKDNNIPLIRIPYYHFDYIEDILEYELGKLGLI